MATRAIHSALGATTPAGSEQITIFIPDKNQLGDPIDLTYWTELALTTLGKLFRGATAFPPGKGVWRNDAKGGELLLETTVMIISFVPAAELNKNIPALREFLHKLGRETSQGEVGIVINKTYHAITKFDEAREGQ